MYRGSVRICQLWCYLVNDQRRNLRSNNKVDPVVRLRNMTICGGDDQAHRIRRHKISTHLFSVKPLSFSFFFNFTVIGYSNSGLEHCSSLIRQLSRICVTIPPSG